MNHLKRQTAEIGFAAVRGHRGRGTMNYLKRHIAEIALQFELDRACQEYREAYRAVNATNHCGSLFPEADARLQVAANKLANLIHHAVAIGWLQDRR